MERGVEHVWRKHQKSEETNGMGWYCMVPRRSELEHAETRCDVVLCCVASGRKVL